MKPLCVDLDGTLIKGDMLWEQALWLFRQRPSVVLEMVAWAVRGKKYFKTQMAARPFPPVDPAIFDADVVEWLRGQAQAGRKVHLVTASHAVAAAAAAAHCDGVFAEVSSSSPTVNLSGDAKAQLLRGQYGAGEFDYAGNAPPDLPPWLASDLAVAVRTRPALLERLRRRHPKMEVRSPLPPLSRTLWRTIRPHQLVKNLLLWLPLILAHRMGESAAVLQTLLAFVSFAAGAAGGYCVNDLLDLRADRLDPRKSLRPLASGELLPVGGAATAAVCFLLAALTSLLLPWPFSVALIGYLILTPFYSMYLKRQPAADVLVLTLLYTLRLYAGGLATGTPVSQWLLSFSLFLFLSLSLLKRYGELSAWTGRLQPDEFLPGRGYQLRDLDLIRALGCASGYVSVLVFTLYVSSPTTATLYPYPELLWGIGVLLLYWLTRIWVLAGRGAIKGDPIPFIFGDPVSWGVAAAAFLIMLGAAVLRHGP